MLLFDQLIHHAQINFRRFTKFFFISALCLSVIFKLLPGPNPFSSSSLYESISAKMYLFLEEKRLLSIFAESIGMVYVRHSTSFVRQYYCKDNNLLFIHCSS